MKMSLTRDLSALALLVAMTGMAQAGGLAEHELEPFIVELETEPPVERVHPPVPQAVVCRWVTVAVTAQEPQYFSNQGLLVADCCCGSIAISGHSFVLSGSTSTRQELVCDEGGHS